MRLLHNFCDRDGGNSANKSLLLSPAERLRLQASRNSNFKSFLDTRNYNTHPSLADKAEQRGKAATGRNHQEQGDAEDEGLLSSILRVLLKEPTDSVYRFWLASCVESYLRSATVAEQNFVAASGLMEHLLDGILKGREKCISTLQINFDLLGELLKCNPEMFKRLDECVTGKKMDRLVEVVVNNLVDSNVFLRSVLLSLQSFKRQHYDSIKSSCMTPAAPQVQTNVAAHAPNQRAVLPPLHSIGLQDAQHLTGSGGPQKSSKSMASPLAVS